MNKEQDAFQIYNKQQHRKELQADSKYSLTGFCSVY
jgi:hypothetical protein